MGECHTCCAHSHREEEEAGPGWAGGGAQGHGGAETKVLTPNQPATSDLRHVKKKFLLRHSGLKIQLQWLRVLLKHRFDPQLGTVG